jgi:hypothetical protein
MAISAQAIKARVEKLEAKKLGRGSGLVALTVAEDSQMEELSAMLSARGFDITDDRNMCIRLVALRGPDGSSPQAPFRPASIVSISGQKAAPAMVAGQ